MVDVEVVGNIILYIIMACCAVGGIAYIINDESGLAKSFNQGIETMSAMFIPICGLMASVPFIKIGVEKLFGALFRGFGADPVVAAAMLMPPDCGSYALAVEMGGSPEILIIAIAIGFMCASTIAFNIPIGLSILEKNDHKYLALGAMSGFMSVPFGVFVSCMIAHFTHPRIRTEFTTMGIPEYTTNLPIKSILVNLIPLTVICVLLALGLKFFPSAMVKGFMVFGKVLTGIMTFVVVISIIQHYTGIFSQLFGSWGFDPLFADEQELFRAIELLGTIAMMLAGAFPMIYLIRKFFTKPLEKLGKVAGLESEGSAGLIASLANGLALFGYIKDMRPKDKVVTMAFLVCAGYSLGDFIAFNVNFQPNLIVPIFVGQIAGGVVGIIFARLFAVPQIEKMETASAQANV